MVENTVENTLSTCYAHAHAPALARTHACNCIHGICVAFLHPYTLTPGVHVPGPVGGSQKKQRDLAHEVRPHRRQVEPAR